MSRLAPWAITLLCALSGCDFLMNEIGKNGKFREGYDWAAGHQVSVEQCLPDGRVLTDGERAMMEGCLDWATRHGRTGPAVGAESEGPARESFSPEDMTSMDRMAGWTWADRERIVAKYHCEDEARDREHADAWLAGCIAHVQGEDL